MRGLWVEVAGKGYAVRACSSAGEMTGRLRAQLSRANTSGEAHLLSKAEIGKISTKSLRRSMATILARRPEVSEEELVAMGEWANATTARLYVERADVFARQRNHSGPWRSSQRSRLRYCSNNQLRNQQCSKKRNRRYRSARHCLLGSMLRSQQRRQLCSQLWSELCSHSAHSFSTAPYETDEVFLRSSCWSASRVVTIRTHQTRRMSARRRSPSVKALLGCLPSST